MSFLAVLGLIFITLKLTNFIEWPLWLVLSPFLLILAKNTILFIVSVIIQLKK